MLSAVATLEATSEDEIRRATFSLTGHSGFVTDCDTAASGHAILSSRYCHIDAVLYHTSIMSAEGANLIWKRARMLK